MVTVKVHSPLFKLQLEWEDGKVSLREDDRESVSDWEYLQSLGLYGKYGISVDLGKCFLTDLVVALDSLAGDRYCEVDEEGLKVLEKEAQAEKESPLPEGAVR